MYALTLFCLLLAGPTEDVTRPILEGDFHDRLAAIASMRTPLPSPAVETFKEWLAAPNSETGSATLKNDLINVLRRQQPAIPGLSDLLISIYQNPAHDQTMRDYAVQHMAALHGTGPKVEATLWEATQETQSSVAGTALLALHRRQADRARLMQTALKMAADAQAAEWARIPALRVCGHLEVPGSAQVARDLLNGEASASVKMAAIATLGEVGDVTDIPMLENIRYGSQQRLVPAVERALNLLRGIHQPAGRTTI